MPAGSASHKKVVQTVNADLEQIRKWARKHKKGSEKERHATAAACLKALRKEGCKSSCCGKPPHKLCKGCPRRLLAEPAVAPLWHAIAG